MRYVTSINLFVLIAMPVSIWLGIAGHVSWPAIGLIWLMQCECTLKLNQNGE